MAGGKAANSPHRRPKTVPYQPSMNVLKCPECFFETFYLVARGTACCAFYCIRSARGVRNPRLPDCAQGNWHIGSSRACARRVAGVIPGAHGTHKAIAWAASQIRDILLAGRAQAVGRLYPVSPSPVPGWRAPRTQEVGR